MDENAVSTTEDIKRVIEVKEGGSLTIIDEPEGAKTAKKGTIDSEGLWHYDKSGSTSIVGGIITGGHGLGTAIAGTQGGGILVQGNLTMEGGTIAGNGDIKDGAGVWVGYGGTFNLKDGSVVYNKAHFGGGVYVYYGVVNIGVEGGSGNSPIIENNVAQNNSDSSSADIMLNNGFKCNIYSGSIGITDVHHSGTLNMSGGVVKDLDGTGGAGAISTVNITGGEIENADLAYSNTTISGGSIGSYTGYNSLYSRSGSLTVTEDGKIETVQLQGMATANIVGGVVDTVVNDSQASIGVTIAGDAQVGTLTNNTSAKITGGSVGTINGTAADEIEMDENMSKIITIEDGQGNTVNNETFTFYVGDIYWSAVTDGSGQITYYSSYTGIVYAEDNDGKIYTGTVTGTGHNTVLTCTGEATATYMQASGKTQTVNNDPLLVVGKVKGDGTMMPTGRVFFMFSGTVEDEELLTDRTKQDAYMQTLQRVMDTPAIDGNYVFNEADAKSDVAATKYNGYADLQPANIELPEGQNWTDLPDELKAVPIRVSLGQDVVTYYTEAPEKQGDTYAFNPDSKTDDEAAAVYRVMDTYEWTTRANNNGNATTLGELFDATEDDYQMSYVETAVEMKSGSTWVEAKDGNAAVTSDKVSEEPNYNIGSLQNIKNQILTWLNDGDASNDFWNEKDSSFGLYLTYEYVTDNICFAKYVPGMSQVSLRGETHYSNYYTGTVNSAPQVLSTTKTAQTLTPSVEVWKNGSWEPVTQSGSAYEFDYDDKIRINIHSSHEGSSSATSGEWAVINNGIFELQSADAENRGDSVTYTYTPPDGNRIGGEANVTFIKYGDTNYQQANVSVVLKMKERTDAAIPYFTYLPSGAVYSDATGSVTLEPVVDTTDKNSGAEISYQWFKGSVKLEGETEPTLTVDVSDLIAGSNKYYLKVTNTNDTVNGNTTAEDIGEMNIVKLRYSSESVKPAELGNITIQGLEEGEQGAYHEGDRITLTAGKVTADNKGTFIYTWYMGDASDETEDIELDSGENMTSVEVVLSEGDNSYYYTVTNLIDEVILSEGMSNSDVSDPSETFTVKDVAAVNRIEVDEEADFGVVEDWNEYVLQNDVNLTKTLNIPEGLNVTIDLNGHVLSCANGEAVISNSGTLRIVDSNPGAVHYGALEDRTYTYTNPDNSTEIRTATDAVWVYDATGNNKEVEIKGGIITGGGVHGIHGIRSANGSKLYLLGGTVAGCAQIEGSGIRLENCSLEMSNSSVIYNFSTREAAGICMSGSKATFTMNENAAVNHNTAAGSAGALRIYNGVFTMNHVSADMSYNRALGTHDGTGNGGAVYQDSGSVNLLAGKMNNNYSAREGGALNLINYSGRIKLSGKIEISGNEAVTGGAVRMRAGSLEIDGKDVLIENNKAVTGGALLVDNGNLFVKSGTLQNNKATGFGGAVYVAMGNIEVGVNGCDASGHDCPVITGNTSDKDAGGGGLYVTRGIVTVYCGSIEDNMSGNSEESKTSDDVTTGSGTTNITGGTIGTVIGKGGTTNVTGGAIGTVIGNGGTMNITGGTIGRTEGKNPPDISALNKTLTIRDDNGPVANKEFNIYIDNINFGTKTTDGEGKIDFTCGSNSNVYAVATENSVIYAGKVLGKDNTVLKPTGEVDVTYNQFAGIDEAASAIVANNNDPMLIVSKVKGDGVMDTGGRVYFMFSGDISDSTSIDGKEYTKHDIMTNNGGALDIFVTALRRVMDTASSIRLDESNALAYNARSVYNGYADLIKAEIKPDKDSSENRNNYADGKWIDIPQEFQKIPLRISLGQDVVTYYNDADITDNGGVKTYTFSKNYIATGSDENGDSIPDDAKYRVIDTFEYTTLKNNSGNPTNLKDFFGKAGLWTTADLSETLVQEIKENGNMQTMESGEIAGHITPAAPEYDADRLGYIKNQILGWLNDTDTSNDFWNQQGTSFGLYITYEYIADNVSFAKYIPETPKVNLGGSEYEAPGYYGITNSQPQVITPSNAEQTISIDSVKIKKDGEGDWKTLSESDNTDGYYQFDYNDHIQITLRSDKISSTGAWSYSNNGGFDLGEGIPGEDGTITYTYEPDGSIVTGEEAVVQFKKATDASYKESTLELPLRKIERTDAKTPVFTLPLAETGAVYKDRTDDITLTAEAVSNDEGEISYKWYKQTISGWQEVKPGFFKSLAMLFTGSDANTLDIDPADIEDNAAYKVVAINTKDVNGATEATAESVISISKLSYTKADATPEVGEITVNPASDIYYEGDTVTLEASSVRPAVEGNLNYEWFASDGEQTEFDESFLSFVSGGYVTSTDTELSAGKKTYMLRVSNTLDVNILGEDSNSIVADSPMRVIEASDLTVVNVTDPSQLTNIQNHYKYVLQNDIILSSTVLVQEGISAVLDLNGHVLSGGNGKQEGTDELTDRRVIKNMGHLTIVDSNPDAIHYGTLEEGVEVPNYENVTGSLWTWDEGADTGATPVSGGIITGGYKIGGGDGTGGGAIYVVGANAVLVMNGGTIAGNTVTNDTNVDEGSSTSPNSDGGGICVNSGTAYIRGGTLLWNLSRQGQDIYIYNNGTINVGSEAEAADTDNPHIGNLDLFTRKIDNETNQINIYSGSIDYLSVRGQTTVNMTGGHLGYLDDAQVSQDNRKINISGGIVDEAHIKYAESAIITGDADVGKLVLDAYTDTEVSGGNVDSIIVNNEANLEVNGGDIGSIDMKSVGTAGINSGHVGTVNAAKGTTNVTGGIIDVFNKTTDEAIVNITGGTIGQINGMDEEELKDVAGELTICDGDGNPVINSNFTVYLNGLGYESATDENGRIKYYSDASKAYAVSETGALYAGVLDGENVLSPQGTVSVRYEQISGKDSTVNNDPLLVVGSVTGDDVIEPSGRLFFMFSGTIGDEDGNWTAEDGTSYTRDEVLQGNSAAQAAYVTELQRVMDTPRRIVDGIEKHVFDVSEAMGESASTLYNGYADLQPADIQPDKDSTSNRSKIDSNGNWTDIPVELQSIPVRISLGQDIVTYYKNHDSVTGEFSEEVTAADDKAAIDAGAVYKVIDTFEYTTFSNAGGRGVTLGELFAKASTYQVTDYSETVVLEANTSAFGASDIAISEPVTDTAPLYDYTKLNSIKDYILNCLNDSDSSNDFWNQKNTAFGLYITYEYIDDNLSFAKYVPSDTSVNLGDTEYTATDYYSMTNSNIESLSPGKADQSLTAKVEVLKDGDPDGQWQDLDSESGYYNFDYNDHIRVTLTTDQRAGEGEWYIANNGNFDFTVAGEDKDAGTITYIYAPDGSQTTEDTATIYFRKASSTNCGEGSVTLSFNKLQKTDVAHVSITGWQSKGYIYKDETGKATLSVNATAADLENGGKLEYTWYKYDDTDEQWKEIEPSLFEAAAELIGIDQPETFDIDTGEITYTARYKVVVTNTNTEVNGDTVSAAEREITVERLAYTPEEVKAAVSDLTLTPEKSTYYLGDAVTFTGTITLPEDKGNNNFTYMWYREDADNADGEREELLQTEANISESGEVNGTFSLKEGNWNYYLEVSNSLQEDGTQLYMLLGENPVVAESAQAYTVSAQPLGEYVFDISKGNILVEDDIVTGKDSEGNDISINMKDAGDNLVNGRLTICVTGETKSNQIIFNRNGSIETLDITLRDVQIAGSDPAIEVSGGGTLNVRLEGNNVLGTSGSSGVFNVEAGAVNVDGAADSALILQADADKAVFYGAGGGKTNDGTARTVGFTNCSPVLQDNSGEAVDLTPAVADGGVTVNIGQGAKLVGANAGDVTVPIDEGFTTYVKVDIDKYNACVGNGYLSDEYYRDTNPSSSNNLYDWKITGENLMPVVTGSTNVNGNRIRVLEDGAKLAIADIDNSQTDYSCIILEDGVYTADAYVAGEVSFKNTTVPAINYHTGNNGADTTLRLIGIPNDDGSNPVMNVVDDFGTTVGINLIVDGIDFTVNGNLTNDLTVQNGANVVINGSIRGDLTVDETSTVEVNGSIGNAEEELYTLTYHEDATADSETRTAYVNKPSDGSSVSAALLDDIFSREGYALTGWQIADKVYNIGGTAIINGDTDLYAVWTEVEKGEQLPEGYSRLNYIESDGLRFMELDYIPNENTKTVALIDGSEQTRQGWIFGVDTSMGQNIYSVFKDTHKSNGDRDYYPLTGSYGSSACGQQLSLIDKVSEEAWNALTTGKNTITLSYNYFSVINEDNEEYSYSSKINEKTDNIGAISPGAPLCVFASHRLNFETIGSKEVKDTYIEIPVGIKLYDMQISEITDDGEKIMRNLIPASDASGTEGLYDTVNKKFYPLQAVSQKSVKLYARVEDNAAVGLSSDIAGKFEYGTAGGEKFYSSSITLLQGLPSDGSVKGWWNTAADCEVDMVYMLEGGVYKGYEPGQLPLILGASYYCNEGTEDKPVYAKMDINVLQAEENIFIIPADLEVNGSDGTGIAKVEILAGSSVNMKVDSENGYCLKRTIPAIISDVPYDLYKDAAVITPSDRKGSAELGTYGEGRSVLYLEIQILERPKFSGTYTDKLTFTME